MQEHSKPTKTCRRYYALGFAAFPKDWNEAAVRRLSAVRWSRAGKRVIQHQSAQLVCVSVTSPFRRDKNAFIF